MRKYLFGDKKLPSVTSILNATKSEENKVEETKIEENKTEENSGQEQ